MVEHHEQRGLIVSDAGHEPGGPEGTIPRKPGCQQIGSDTEHGLLVCGRGAKNSGEVVLDSEFRIVHPHGSTAPDGYVDQPLTKPRHGRQPVPQCFFEPYRIESFADIEQQHDPHLQRGVLSVGDQRHDVIGAYAINRIVSPHTLHFPAGHRSA
jgi:hypothetical protein